MESQKLHVIFWSRSPFVRSFSSTVSTCTQQFQPPCLGLRLWLPASSLYPLPCLPPTSLCLRYAPLSCRCHESSSLKVTNTNFCGRSSFVHCFNFKSQHSVLSCFSPTILAYCPCYTHPPGTRGYFFPPHACVEHHCLMPFSDPGWALSM